MELSPWLFSYNWVITFVMFSLYLQPSLYMDSNKELLDHFITFPQNYIKSKNMKSKIVFEIRISINKFHTFLMKQILLNIKNWRQHYLLNQKKFISIYVRGINFRGYKISQILRIWPKFETFCTNQITLITKLNTREFCFFQLILHFRSITRIL